MIFTMCNTNTEKLTRFSDSENKRISILLRNFSFYHRPSSVDRIDPKYREQANPIEQLTNWLRQDGETGGSYLITGYRGAGKSSLVGAVLKKLKDDYKKSMFVLSVNLGQDNLNDVEVMRILAKQLLNKVEEAEKAGKECFFTATPRTFWKILLCVLCGLATIFSLVTIWKCLTSLYPVITKICEMDFVLYSIVAAVCQLLICMLCLKYAVRWINKHVWFYSETYWELYELCLQLNATTTSESAAEASAEIPKFRVNKKKSRTVQPLAIQELQYRLIDILEKLRSHKSSLRIFVVFDELDKISVKERSDDGQIPEYAKLSGRYDRPVSSTERAQEVMSLISNLKYFLTTAKASFIFIAGRELYEAFQADISDRDFSFCSIFHGVLNVDSFFSAPHNAHNSVLLTEDFVLHQILPPGFEQEVTKEGSSYDRDFIFSLKNYVIYRKTAERDYFRGETEAERNIRISGEAMFLYRFITYLSFISNGSPKKIALFFEKYVRSGKYLMNEKNVEFLQGNSEQKEDNDSKMYLSLGYYSLFKVNFIHYLVYPIMQAMINSNTHYGDKLLVSASFLITYIFKLHNNGFSWRNLEQIPELQEINKTPELREYISNLIYFMNHSLVTTIPCGLFHYKFPMRLSEEISYQSRLSSEMNALLNFSPTDMRGIKKHYIALMKKYGEPDRSEYAQASICHALADIFMLEENYSGAIRSYERSIELVSKFVKVEMNTCQQRNYLLFFNRSMLKLGLAHEKRRTDNSAYTVYSDLQDFIDRNRQTLSVLCRDTRTFHLVFLAKLYVLEKIDTDGFTKEHLKEAIDLFRKIKWGRVIRADFYRKLGDILFYKNSMKADCFNPSVYYRISMGKLFDLNLLKKSAKRCCGSVYVRTNDLHAKLLAADTPLYKHQPERDNFIYHLAIACENMGHVSLYENYKPEATLAVHTLHRFCRWFCSGEPDKRTYGLDMNNFEQSMLYFYSASLLYNVSCERSLSTKCFKEMMYVFLQYVREVQAHAKMERLNCNIVINTADYILNKFLISVYRQKEHINLKEINALKWLQNLRQDEKLRTLYLSIMPDIDEMLCLYYTLMLEVWRNIDLEKREPSLSRVHACLSDFFQSRWLDGNYVCSTLVTDVHYLKLRGKMDWEQLVKILEIREEFPDSNSLSFNAYMRGQRYDIGSNFLGLEDPTLDDRLDLVECLIADGISCLSRIQALIIPQQTTTLFNNSFKADILYKLLDFVKLSDIVCTYYTTNNNLQNRLDKFRNNIARAARTAGCGNIRNHYLAETCIHYCAKARQMHQQGKAYQEMLRNLFFLEDDLNNDSLQFYLAMERLELKKGIIQRREVFLKNSYRRESVFQRDSELT